MNEDTNMQRKSDDDNAIKIQSAARGFLARKKYRVKHLKSHQLDSYKTFVVGNDPFMPKELDNFNEPNDKIAVVGTSGMRVVSLACKLGNRNQTPKIFLVDNSREVQAFWKAMQDFMANDVKAGTKESFLAHLKTFLQYHGNLYRDIPPEALKKDCKGPRQYLNQDINGYFKALIEKYDYDYVRNVILHASLIKQSWTDKDTFIKLKNITSYLGINKVVMYPSNIVSCLHDKQAEDQLLKNIEQMTPVLSIHTDLCSVHGRPERVILATNQNRTNVTNTIFEPTKCKPEQSDLFSNMLSMNDLFFMMQAMNGSMMSNTSMFGRK